MRFLLDTDTCSAYLKGDRRAQNRFLQHTGGLCISAISVAELYVWVFRSSAPDKRAEALLNLLSDVEPLDLDLAIARMFGETKTKLLSAGTPKPQIDLLIACTAMTYDLTLVTHNLSDFNGIPALRVVDWLT